MAYKRFGTTGLMIGPLGLRPGPGGAAPEAYAW